MPNWCYNRIEVKGSAEDALRMKAYIHSQDSEFDFNKVLPYPEEYAKLDAEVDEDGINRSKGFNGGGYEWCIAHWGTKWNACEVSIADDGSEIDFDTAWSPSLKVTNALSKLFPALIFTHRFEEGESDFSGYAVYRNGELIESADGEYDDYPITKHDCEDEEEGEDGGK
jgi:hypothetical protein